jgi:hypothetical protein
VNKAGRAMVVQETGDPALPRALKAWAWAETGRYRAERGLDPVPALDRAIAEAESARERAEDALREARSHDPDVRARRSAAAAGWSLVGGILREGRVRSALVALVAALLLAASVGLAHLSGVDSAILSTLLGSPDARTPHP